MPPKNTNNNNNQHNSSGIIVSVILEYTNHLAFLTVYYLFTLFHTTFTATFETHILFMKGLNMALLALILFMIVFPVTSLVIKENSDVEDENKSRQSSKYGSINVLFSELAKKMIWFPGNFMRYLIIEKWQLIRIRNVNKKQEMKLVQRLFRNVNIFTLITAIALALTLSAEIVKREVYFQDYERDVSNCSDYFKTGYNQPFCVMPPSDEYNPFYSRVAVVVTEEEKTEEQQSLTPKTNVVILDAAQFASSDKTTTTTASSSEQELVQEESTTRYDFTFLNTEPTNQQQKQHCILIRDDPKRLMQIDSKTYELKPYSHVATQMLLFYFKTSLVLITYSVLWEIWSKTCEAYCLTCTFDDTNDNEEWRDNHNNRPMRSLRRKGLDPDLRDFLSTYYDSVVHCFSSQTFDLLRSLVFVVVSMMAFSSLKGVVKRLVFADTAAAIVPKFAPKATEEMQLDILVLLSASIGAIACMKALFHPSVGLLNHAGILVTRNNSNNDQNGTSSSSSSSWIQSVRSFLVGSNIFIEKSSEQKTVKPFLGSFFLNSVYVLFDIENHPDFDPHRHQTPSQSDLNERNEIKEILDNLRTLDLSHIYDIFMICFIAFMCFLIETPVGILVATFGFFQVLFPVFNEARPPLTIKRWSSFLESSTNICERCLDLGNDTPLKIYVPTTNQLENSTTFQLQDAPPALQRDASFLKFIGGTKSLRRKEKKDSTSSANSVFPAASAPSSSLLLWTLLRRTNIRILRFLADLAEEYFYLDESIITLLFHKFFYSSFRFPWQDSHPNRINILLPNIPRYCYTGVDKRSSSQGMIGKLVDRISRKLLLTNAVAHVSMMLAVVDHDASLRLLMNSTYPLINRYCRILRENLFEAPYNNNRNMVLYDDDDDDEAEGEGGGVMKPIRVGSVEVAAVDNDDKGDDNDETTKAKTKTIPILFRIPKSGFLERVHTVFSALRMVLTNATRDSLSVAAAFDLLQNPNFHYCIRQSLRFWKTVLLSFKPTKRDTITTSGEEFHNKFLAEKENESELEKAKRRSGVVRFNDIGNTVNGGEEPFVDFMQMKTAQPLEYQDESFEQVSIMLLEFLSTAIGIAILRPLRFLQTLDTDIRDEDARNGKKQQQQQQQQSSFYFPNKKTSLLKPNFKLQKFRTKIRKMIHSWEKVWDTSIPVLMDMIVAKEFIGQEYFPAARPVFLDEKSSTLLRQISTRDDGHRLAARRFLCCVLDVLLIGREGVTDASKNNKNVVPDDPTSCSCEEACSVKVEASSAPVPLDRLCNRACQLLFVTARARTQDRILPSTFHSGIHFVNWTVDVALHRHQQQQSQKEDERTETMQTKVTKKSPTQQARTLLQEVLHLSRSVHLRKYQHFFFSINSSCKELIDGLFLAKTRSSYYSSAPKKENESDDTNNNNNNDMNFNADLTLITRSSNNNNNNNNHTLINMYKQRIRSDSATLTDQYLFMIMLNESLERLQYNLRNRHHQSANNNLHGGGWHSTWTREAAKNFCLVAMVLNKTKFVPITLVHPLVMSVVPTLLLQQWSELQILLTHRPDKHQSDLYDANSSVLVDGDYLFSFLMGQNQQQQSPDEVDTALSNPTCRIFHDSEIFALAETCSFLAFGLAHTYESVAASLPDQKEAFLRTILTTSIAGTSTFGAGAGGLGTSESLLHVLSLLLPSDFMLLYHDALEKSVMRRGVEVVVVKKEEKKQKQQEEENDDEDDDDDEDTDRCSICLSALTRNPAGTEDDDEPLMSKIEDVKAEETTATTSNIRLVKLQKCKHMFHLSCAASFLAKKGNNNQQHANQQECPLCRTSLV